MIQGEDVGGVVVLRLDHGPVNALDLELARTLTQTFTDLARSGCRAIVLTGSGSVFSGGVDLWRLAEGGHAYAEAFLPALSDALEAIFLCPKPVVAAINGHALAGGCVVALAGDRRVMTDGDARIGLTELSAGLPFPSAALEVVRFAIGDHHLNEIALSGARLTGIEATRTHLVDELVGVAEVVDRAVAQALELGTIPEATFRLSKAQMRAEAARRIATARAEHDADVISLWGSESAAQGIAAYMAQVKAS